MALIRFIIPDQAEAELRQRAKERGLTLGAYIRMLLLQMLRRAA